MWQCPEWGDRASLNDPERPVGCFTNILRWNKEGVLGSGRSELFATGGATCFHLHDGAGILDDILGVFRPAENQCSATGQRASAPYFIVGEPGWALRRENQTESGASRSLEHRSGRVTRVAGPGDQLRELVNDDERRALVGAREPGRHPVPQVEQHEIPEPSLRVIDR